MTKYQNAFSQMLAAVRIICNEYQPIWNTNATFSAAFNDGIIAIDAPLVTATGQQSTVTKGVTSIKQEARTALAEQLRFIASRIVLYALNAGDATLQKDAHLPASTIKLAKDDAVVGMVTRITGLATTHLADLASFGVTAAQVSALSAAGIAYAAQIGAPARKRSTSKEATKTIAALIKTARTQLRTMDVHMILWRESNPDFYAQYQMARRIIKPGFRTRALEVSVQDAKGAPVAGAEFHLPSERLMRRTSEKGLCRVAHLPAGEHRAKVRADGYAMQEVVFIIANGQKTRLTLVLQKAEL